MSFFRRQRPAAQPTDGVPASSADDLRRALLALNGPGVPYVIRDGAPEGVDLVAAWETVKPARAGMLGRTREGEAFQIRMRLVPDAYEVRSIDHAWEFTLTGNDPARRRTRSHTQGQLKKTYWGHEVGPTPDPSHTYRFNTADLKSALRSTTLTAAWTWHPLHFGKP